MSLDELRALEQAATPGPWRSQGWDAEERAAFIVGGGPEGSMQERLVAAGLPALAVAPNWALADAALIVAARNALPDLLGRVAAAEAERDALRKKLEWVVGLFEQAISELPVEESAYQGDDFFAIPRAIDLVLTLRYELPGLRAVVAASVPSGPVAGGET